MCVDTHASPQRCCCGCMTLTQGSILIGILNVFGAIGMAISGNWYGFTFNLVLATLFIMVLVKPYDAGIRKIIYYVYLIGTILGLIGFIIFIIYAFASDWESDWCYDTGMDYRDDFNWDSLSDCEDFINTFLIVLIVIFLLL